jgi:hypothetical protein
VTPAPLRAFALAGMAVALVACGTSASPPPVATGSGVAPSTGEISSPVEGVPIAIEAEGFTDIRAFTIRTDDGRQLRFVLGPLENATQFPPTHLAEHVAGSTRIRVFFRPDGPDDVAYRLEDAPTR